MWRAPDDVLTARLDVDRSPLALALVHRLLEIDSVEGVRRAIVEGARARQLPRFVRLWERDEGYRARREEPVAVELEQQLIVGSPDLSPEGIATGIEEAKLTVATPDCASRRRRGHRRDPAHCFDSTMRIHALESAGRADLRRDGTVRLRLRPTDPAGANEDRRNEHRHRPRSVLFCRPRRLSRASTKSVRDRRRGHSAWSSRPRPDSSAASSSCSPPPPSLRCPHRSGEARRATRSASRTCHWAPHFRGASVGWATAAPNEDNDALLRRAATELKVRKARRSRPADTSS